MTEFLSSYGILNTLGSAYFEVDIKGIMVHCNQVFLDNAESTIEHIAGKHYRHLVDPKQVVDIYSAFNTIYKTHENRRMLFNFVRHKTGGFRTAEGVVGPVLSPTNGEVIGFRGILFDVTERIREEMDLLSAKQSAERELAIGRKIQFSFLPTDLTKVDGWDLDVRFHSAREVAGDFYDVFPISNGKRLAFIVADVCDKGVGAAMYMAIFRTLLRAFANINTATQLTMALTAEVDPLKETESMIFRKEKILAVGAQPLLNAVQMTNQYIATNHGSSNMFVTLFFGVLNPADGKLLYINAGHEPPIVVSGGKIAKRLEPTGPAVGLMENLKFEIGETELAHGDLLFAYTDGIIDARDMNNKSFTEEHLLEEIAKKADSPENIVKHIMALLHDHISEQDQFDDLTLLGLYRK